MKTALLKKLENKLIMRIVVAIAICLASMTIFSSCKKDSAVPSSVENFTATAGDEQVSLLWETPLDDGGAEITGYEITIDNWTNKVTKTATQFSHTYTNLINDTEYMFKVRALNANGVGMESIQTATPIPSKVSEIDGTYVGTYTTTNQTIDYSWSSTPTIEFKNGKYTYTGLDNGSYFDSGYGNFSIVDNKIIFQLVDYNKPMEYIGVMDGWLLKGQYEYEFGGNKLTFTKTYSDLGMTYSCIFELEKNADK